MDHDDDSRSKAPGEARLHCLRVRGLARPERLLHSPDYKRVFRHGRCHRAGILRVHFLDGRHGHSRLGLVVSKKVGNSVVRSLVKRRLRHAFRTVKARLPRALDVVLVATPPARGATFSQLVDVLEEFCARCDRAPSARSRPRSKAR